MTEFAMLFNEYPVSVCLVLAAAVNYFLIMFGGLFE